MFPIEIDGHLMIVSLVKNINQSIDSKNKFISANSINIARLLPQITYYFYTYAKIQTKKIGSMCTKWKFRKSNSRSFSKKMGLPIDKFICALNIIIHFIII